MEKEYGEDVPEIGNIIRRLLAAGKIKQPRELLDYSPSIVDGNWILASEVKQWVDENYNEERNIPADTKTAVKKLLAA